MFYIKDEIDKIKILLENDLINKKAILNILCDIEKNSTGILWDYKEELLSSYTVNEIKDKEICKVESGCNLLIEGDNLYSLNWLLKKYTSTISAIIIDPPYNSKKSHYRYSDNRIDKKDNWKHSMWLNFMYNRLVLAKELLADNGIIFINIDDSELYQLKLLCDNVFGEKNFVANLVWKNRTGANDKKNNLPINHEYVLIYKKKEDIVFNGKPKDFKSYKNPDNHPKGDWILQDMTCNKTSTERPSLYYDIIDPATGDIYKCNPNRVWAYSKETMNTLIESNLVVFKKGCYPKRKKFITEVRSKTMPVSSWMDDNLFADNTSLMNVLGSKLFAYPKPIKLIKELISYIPNENAIILDFFAGSGTTGHAVLELNNEDGGNRQFILCTNNENNICEEVTYQRLKNVINGYTSLSGKEIDGIDANLKYLKIKTEENPLS